jgi:putative ABC transport system permease protein
MNLFNLIRIAYKALQRNKLRAFLTMLGIIIGVASVIAMVAIGQGSKQSIHDQLSSMGSNMITVLPSSNLNGGVRIAGSSFQTLTQKDITALQKAQYITELSPSITSKGQAINGALNWPTTIQGVSPDYLDIRKLSLKDGIAFTE